MCQQTLCKIMLIAGILISLPGCRPAVELPTPIPTAIVPGTFTPPPTRAELPPTRDLSTATPAPTAEPTAVVPTLAPTTSPTPVIGPVIYIDAPTAGQSTVMGREVSLSGFAQVTSDMSIQVGLTDAAGQTLAGAAASVELNQWTAQLAVPQLISGGATAHAVIVDAGGSELARDSVPLLLIPDRNITDSYVQLIRPEPGSVGVAGHNFFVDGQLWRQGGGRLQVAVLLDDCREEVADIYFQLGTSSYWQGYLILPRDVAGPACVVAWVGTPGTADWRAAMMPIDILHQDDPAARGLMISNPRAARNLTAGETILVTGVAYNIPGRTVNIEVLLENGQVLAEAEDDADFYGYWSAEVVLPPNAEDAAVVRVTTGDRAQPDSEAEVHFNIVPPS